MAFIVALNLTKWAIMLAGYIDHSRQQKALEKEWRKGPDMVQSYWDGRCFYPYAWDGFSVDAHLGRWYYVAGHMPRFKQHCSCIMVEYTRTNKEDTLRVEEKCQLDILSDARSVPTLFLSEDVRTGEMKNLTRKKWGDNGVYRVEYADPFYNDNFTKACEGPNYIVSEQKSDHAIIQGANFSSLYILSRSPDVEDHVIDRWIHEARILSSWPRRTPLPKTVKRSCTRDGVQRPSIGNSVKFNNKGVQNNKGLV
ncbi:Lipocalin-like domain-containing protein [Ophiocordyceps camponoti-floridani]|uniref:Lipocalin-like domain-containing protein n=1 Tax=Ophiocordyceps camponoti-floridani TaxID=2030778 RepID=A0A8H4VGX2_9HYPO|nr:Lipocalin-like domain-containing protein [Ophiocordyceps camponoti-floridani]